MAKGVVGAGGVGGAGGGKLHTQNFGMSAFHEASAKPAAAHAPGGGGAKGSIPGGGGGLAGAFGGEEVGDPAISGNFERERGLTIAGVPTGIGAGLTEHGKEQQAANARFQGYSDVFLKALKGGATEPQAFGEVLKLPGAGNDFFAHPTALRSLDNLAKVLSPAAEKWAPGNNGQQYQIDQQTGKIIGNAPIPGYTQPPASITRTFVGQDGTVYGLTPDGKARPIQIDNGGGGGGGGSGNQGNPGSTNNGITVPGGSPAGGGGGDNVLRAPAKPAKPLTTAELAETQGLTRLGPALDIAKSNLSAAAAGGVGKLGMGLAEYTPWGGQAATNYETSRDNLKASIGSALNSSSRLKQGYQDMQNQIPGSMASEDFARSQLGSISFQYRQNIATLYTQLSKEGKDTSSLMPLMQQYNAYPDYMNKLTDRRQLLRTNPGALSNNDVVNLYAQEAYNPDKSFALPKNEALALADQMNQRNLWGARADIIKADPNRTWLPDGQMVNSRYHDEITNYANQTPPSLRTPKTGPVQTANPQADQQAPQTQPGQPQAARPQTDTQQGQPGQQAATPMPDSRGSAYAPVGETEATQPDASTPPAQNPTQSPAVDQDFSAGEQGPGQSPQAPPAPPPPTTLSNHYDPVPQANGGGFVAGQPPAAPSQTGVQVPVPPAAPQGGTPSLLDAIQAQSLGGF